MKKINLAFYINFNHKKWLGGLNIILNLANYLAENRKTLNHNYNIILISKDEKIKEDFNIVDVCKYYKKGDIFAYDIMVKEDELKQVLTRLKEFDC